jgi:hypothetical protein
MAGPSTPRRTRLSLAADRRQASPWNAPVLRRNGIRPLAEDPYSVDGQDAELVGSPVSMASRFTTHSALRGAESTGWLGSEAALGGGQVADTGQTNVAIWAIAVRIAPRWRARS